MLRQLLFGGAISLGNIVIHSLAMAFVVGAARVAGNRFHLRPTVQLVAVMIATVAVLMAFHLCEIAVWSLAYALLDAAPEGADHLYFAFVNYATLGYGDIVPVARWRLLGPMTALNGALLVGWSTAVIFHVLRKTMDSSSSD